MANHYHIVSNLDLSEHGGTKADHYYGPGLPMDDARRDADALATERGLNKLAGGLWGDSDFTGYVDGEGQWILIDPCDNEIDFDLDWHAYRDDKGSFHRAPKGEPCTSLIKKEYARFFFNTH